MNGTPWFAVVSFVNPHDIAHFPYAYGLADSGFNPPPGSTAGYQPPPSDTTATTTYRGIDRQNDVTQIPPLNAPAPYVQGQPPAGWNNLDDPPDDPSLYPYSQAGLQANGIVKPGLQAYFQNQFNVNYGQIQNNFTDGWNNFLNYYFWMQNCVDLQIGNVIGALKSNHLWGHTLVIFTSDHGDFGGSHNLRSKGGALYDECIRVPLYISTPEQRANNQTSPVARSLVCSSVDLLPFIYSMALGNESWRCIQSSNDMVYYLRGRESIRDAIYSFDGTYQRRTAPGIPDANDCHNQPYILHTADAYPSAYVPNSPTDAMATNVYQPSHAIAFRTVDLTLNNYQAPYGGGKLGMYNYWAPGTTCPDTSKNPQFEFYDYSTYYPNGNYAETGNQGVFSIDSNGVTTPTAKAQQYLQSFQTIDAELYGIPSQTSPQAYVWYAYQAALAAYLAFVNQSCSPQGSCASCPT